MSSSIDELEIRLADLKILADRIYAETRTLSYPLESWNGVHINDPLVTLAESLGVPVLHPLTIGTLLASVLGEIDSVEWALKSLTAVASHRKE